MAQLRNLQLFRNGSLLTGSIETVKGLIETALSAGTITLSDGEPISVRYKENDETDVVKGLFGVAYNNGTNTSILWNDGAITIDTTPKNDAFVTLNYTVDGNGNYTLAVAEKTQTLATHTITEYKVIGGTDTITVEEYNALTEDEKENYEPVYEDGLATALDVRKYVKSYRVSKEGTRYQLVETDIDGNETSVQEAWDFKDMVVTSGKVIEVVLANDNNYYDKTECTYNESTGEYTPNEGATAITDSSVNEACTYLVLTIANSNNKVYIKAKDLVDSYTAGNGLTLANHEFSVALASDSSNILRFNDNGELIATVEIPVYTAGDASISVSDNHEISVNISSNENNALTLDENGLLVIDHDTTYTAGNNIEIDANNNNAISVKVSSKSDNELTTNTTEGEEGLYVAPYTAGNGIDITNKVVSAKVSNQQGNIITVDENGLYAAPSAVADAVVTNTNDTLNVTTNGVLNQTAMTVIENYIDHYDCGTFTIE